MDKISQFQITGMTILNGRALLLPGAGQFVGRAVLIQESHLDEYIGQAGQTPAGYGGILHSGGISGR